MPRQRLREAPRLDARIKPRNGQDVACPNRAETVQDGRIISRPLERQIEAPEMMGSPVERDGGAQRNVRRKGGGRSNLWELLLSASRLSGGARLNVTVVVRL
jgi:hypothetical protein